MSSVILEGYYTSHLCKKKLNYALKSNIFRALSVKMLGHFLGQPIIDI